MNDVSTPTLVSLYAWGKAGKVRIAEFRWTPADGVTLTVLNPRRRAYAEDLYKNGVMLVREERLVTREDGPEFMRALRGLPNSSYYALVDESPMESE